MKMYKDMPAGDGRNATTNTTRHDWCTNTNLAIAFMTLNHHCLTVFDFALNIFLMGVAFVILFLNAIVLRTLYIKSAAISDNQYNQNTYVFIANLATADFVVGLVLLYDISYNILQYRSFLECTLRMGLFIALNLASVFILACLTVDRFFAIAEPFLHSRVVTSKRIKVLLLIVWLVSLAIGLMPSFGVNSKNLAGICNFFDIMLDEYLILNLVVFFIPLFVMLVLYGILVRISMRHTADLRRTMVGDVLVQWRWKSAKTASVIVGAYFICWFPVGAFMLIVVADLVPKGLPIHPNNIFTYLLGIGVLNSILNPIIYASKIDLIKQAFRRVFCCSKCRSKTTSDQSSSLLRMSRTTTATSM